MGANLSGGGKRDTSGRTPQLSLCSQWDTERLGKQVEEDLIAENQRLQMENDYLEKMNALFSLKIVMICSFTIWYFAGF